MSTPRSECSGPTEDSPIRPASPAEAADLAELTIRSKAYWGYDQAFLDDCRDALTLTAEYVASEPVFVLDVDGRTVGFYGLRALGPDDVELAGAP